MSDTIWSILIGVLFFLDIWISVIVVYLISWRGMQQILGPTYEFHEFVEEIERHRAEYPPMLPPF